MKNQSDSAIFANESARWQAVLARDERADGAFVYGVSSTHIYCRASCPSRKPRRENTRFFEAPANAEHAGFRACKRCRPAQFCQRSNRAGAQSLPHHRSQRGRRDFARRARPTRGAPARFICNAVSHASSAFRRANTRSRCALGQLKAALQRGETVLHAALDAGYNSTASLYRDAMAQLGMTPATYGHGGKNAQIWFGIAPCELGAILQVATTAKPAFARSRN